MPDPLKPACEIPLQASLDGSVMMPTLEFSRADSTVLYVRQPVEVVGWWARVAWRAPDVAGVVLVLALVMALVAARRVMGKVQDRGRLFCRKCNYKITPPLASRDARGRVEIPAGSRCPECGTQLEKKRPVIGRSRWVRMWPVWGVALPLVVLSAGVLWATLQPWVPAMGGRPWPFEGFEKLMPSWSVQKVAPKSHMGPDVHWITRWRVPEGKQFGEVWEEGVHGFYNGMLSPDGARYVCIAASATFQAQLVVIDTKTGERRWVGISSTMTASADMLTFSTDSKRVFVQEYAGQPASANGAQKGNMQLLAYDLATLEPAQIATEDVPMSVDSSGKATEWPYTRFAIDASGETVKWALVVHQYGPGRTLGPVVVIAPDGGMGDAGEGRKEFKVAVPAGTKSWYAPTMEDGGKTVEVNFYGTGVTTLVDLATGATTPGVSKYGTVYGESPSGKYRLARSGASAPPPSATMPAGTADVIERATGTVVATLGIPGGTWWHGGAVSEDGRFAAACYYNARKEFVVGVWEVGKGSDGVTE